MKTGIELIAEERQEQIAKHGFTSSHDDEINADGELLKAAWYALTLIDGAYPEDWGDWFRQKLIEKPETERLIIAGALISAEIDRRKRIEKTKGE